MSKKSNNPDSNTPESHHGHSHDDVVHDAEARYAAMDNYEEDWEAEEEEAFGGKKEPIPEDELDMTPMVDVTFLLLIFFMVTASFSLQKSIQQPPSKSDAPSKTVQEDEEIVGDYVEVIIDQNNTYYVTTRDADEEEAPSEQEMRAKVKDAKEHSTATRLIIKAHVDSLHKKLVTAWDAGVNVGMDKIEVQTMEQDY